MAEQDDPWIDETFEARVRETAYFLWENDGRPQGRETEYWFSAVQQCLHEQDADGAVSQAPANDDGAQADDNIDDLGRPLNDKGKSLDQPVAGTKKA